MAGHVLCVGSFRDRLTVWRHDSVTRKLEFLSEVACAAPTWLTLSSEPRLRLFTTNEVDDMDGEPTGGVSEFEFMEGGRLQFVGRAKSFGKHPTHLCFLPGPRLIACNYSSGSFSVHSVSTQFSVGASSQLVEHRGRGAHAHQAIITKHPTESDRRCVIAVADLGLDRILQYIEDLSTGLFVEAWTAVEFPKGSGPRHVALHPTLDLAFVVCELSSTLAVLRYDRASGALSHFSCCSSWSTLSCSTESQGLEKDMAGAEVLVSHSGKFVYVSNRDNSRDPHLNRSSIAVFEIEAAVENRCAPRMRLIQLADCRGRHPRHFALLDGDSVMIVANKDSENVVSFLVDPASGLVDVSSAVESTSLHLVEPAFVLPVTAPAS